MEKKDSYKKRKNIPEEENNVTNEAKNITTMVSQEQVTLDNLQNRWAQVFQKYSSLGYETIFNVWGSCISALNNPFIQNNRLKQQSTMPLKVGKEELKAAIADPENNEQILRSFSAWLTYTNYVYLTLMELYRDTPKYFYYTNPVYLENGNKSKIKKDSARLDKILKTFNPQLSFKTIASQVFMEGKCSYLLRTSYDKQDINYVLLQKLKSDNVKITGFGSKQRFIVSFDMTIFLEPGYSVEQYPEFIQKAWQDMIDNGVIIYNKRGKAHINAKANLPLGHMLEVGPKDRYMYWVQLPQDLCWTFYTNGGHSNAFPDALGLFEDLNSLDDYRWLQGNLLSKGVNSILTAEVPLVKDPKPGADSTAISVDSILGFTDLFTQNVSDNVLPFFAPFQDYSLHTVESQPEALDVVYDRVRDLIATSGNSALLSISDKPSISSVQTARMLQEAKTDYLTKQFEEFLNCIVNDNFDLTYEWKVTLHSGIFNWRDDCKMTKELVLQGATGLLPRLLSFYDMSLEDYKGELAYLDALDIKLEIDEEYEETNPVGRPSLNEDEVENDNTGSSKDAGTNDSEIKEDVGI